MDRADLSDVKKFLIAFILLAGLAAAGYWVGWPAYKDWKEQRSIARARQALQKDDYRGAALFIRQALGMNPSNVEACRSMAQLNDKLRLPSAVQWWQRVVELEPQSVSNRLELARCAVLHGDFVLAAHSLKSTDKTDRNTVAFHQMAAMVAIGMSNIAAADWHFTEAARIEPENKVVQLNRAIIRMQAKDKDVAADAIKTLEALSEDPAYRKDALRHLAMFASHAHDYRKATEIANELASTPPAQLSDKLMYLSALKDSKNPKYSTYLAALETECSKDADDVNALSAWMLDRRMTSEAREWLDSLPPEMKEKRPVKLARADCFMVLRDWPALERLLEDEKWGELDFLRLAMLSRACYQEHKEMEGQANWRAAEVAASDSSRQLTVLINMANKWGLDNEKEDLLWVIVRRFPSERWALDALDRLYQANGNTLGLYRLYSLLNSYDSDDAVLGNNLASVSLLLNMQKATAAELALKAYTRYPSNEAFASTHAYSLYLHGKTNEALKVFESLAPRQLETPGIAVYYGVILAANRKTNLARQYLEIANSAHLLPEERALLIDAKKRL